MKAIKLVCMLVVFLLLISGIYMFSEVKFINNVEKALSIATKENKNIFMAVTAEWCPYCQKMKKEIFETEFGEKLLKDFICVEVDFDTSYGQKIKRKYRIISLPTVVLLAPSGKEIDRIIGYAGKEWFEKLLKKYTKGKDPLPELQKKLEKDLDNPELLFEVGQRVLQRGDEKKGIELLTRIIDLDPENSSDYTDNALFVLGRYYSRVKENPEKGLKYWKELFLKYPESDYGQGALSWMLRAYRDLNKLDDAENFLKNELKNKPENSYLYFSIAYFYLNYRKDLNKALSYAKEGLKIDSENLSLLLLIANINEKLKNYPEAVKILEKAVKLKPEDKSLKEKLEELKKQLRHK
ncbi:thioredoxin family protein [Candidatus Aminicenantes bacterium AC-335-A11]|nr:thioredoxin family protein [SCandidatus Aminicenantes bacterium Aminicenantia_JdfR_composite]MCP2597041.1 thioredoxin family protein [Candidatus Aminicenantes bacterium AC-335-G13]MCP2597995.1 thioredoxin family protein [Candidatus Aminicenantes bacterium AC-335-L06]MCP2605647.1 thioredoxin family protein [Candidatus Aminicenantes bacterium AC-335-O07]MCP2606178.1 thioredoxin family protein [Candidatus Aminicenantes bacterium AC-708-I09]MCP2618849.1 thioredoxin family protein [Candidatus Am